jgi:hypothetical protein
MIYEHGEQWWDIDRGKLLIRPPELSEKFYKQNHLVVNQEKLCEGNDSFSLRSVSVHTSK